MNEVRILEHKEFGTIRTIFDEQGRVLFYGNDVAKALGYINPRDAIRRHCKGVVKHDGLTVNTNRYGTETEQVMEMSYIYEPDVFRLIMKSKLPLVDAFEKWVFEDVLPSIRKYGIYATEELLENKALLNEALEMLEEERTKSLRLKESNASLTEILRKYTPKINFVESILNSDCTMTVTQIAADYGLSAIILNRILEKKGVQKKVNGQWVLRSKHMNKGYTYSQTAHVGKHKRCTVRTMWTQLGRQFIHQLMSEIDVDYIMDIFTDA